MRPQPNQMLGFAVLGIFIFIALELIERPPHKVFPAPATNTTGTITNLYARAALSNALLRVYADLARAKTADETNTLRAIESTLTNLLK